MQEIDNISLLAPLLNFPDNDTFYYVQVLERKSGFTKQRYSSAIVNLEKSIPGIKEVCLKFGARAYISVIPRSLKKFTVELGCEILKRMSNNVYQPSNFHLPDSVVLSPKVAKPKGSTWLFDIDNPDFKEEVEDWCKGNGIIIKAEVPTFHGYHFLVQPFNPVALNINVNTMKVELLENIKFDIKRDANTILYGIES